MNCNKDGFYNSVKEWLDAGMPLNSFVLGDCMQGMAVMPDKFANLAIVDPPYGIGASRPIGIEARETIKYSRKTDKRWDKNSPNQKYFENLYNVSCNQIIFGANYFVESIFRSSGWISWYKGSSCKDRTFSEVELIFSSFNVAARQIEISPFIKNGNRIHPTQKPEPLYRWLLQNYAQPDDIILDTHVGSASSLSACEQMGFQYIGFEIDSDYFCDACNRIIQARKLLQQNEIFQREEVYNGRQIQHELF